MGWAEIPKSSVDYATDNITVYRFCNYGCRYCWAWRVPVFRSRVERGKYDPVAEARRYLRRSGRVIVVSFTADPYPQVELEERRTREVLSVLAENPRNRVLVLTKNPVIALRDVDLMAKHGDMWLGTTLTALDSRVAYLWEPGAPSPVLRVVALERAREAGVRTWVSIEPIIPGVTYPEAIVEETVDFVDWYVLGSLNYVRQLRLPYREPDLREWYREHVVRALELLSGYGKPYFIKKELRRIIGSFAKKYI